MAGKKTKYGSVKRFGPRYGRTLKQKAGFIESQQKQTYVCPQCHYKKVRQETTGIWVCEKCGAKFTSKAYLVSKLPLLKTAEQEE